MLNIKQQWAKDFFLKIKKNLEKISGQVKFAIGLR